MAFQAIAYVLQKYMTEVYQYITLGCKKLTQENEVSVIHLTDLQYSNR